MKKKLMPWQRKLLWKPTETNAGAGWKGKSNWHYRPGEIYNMDGAIQQPELPRPSRARLPEIPDAPLPVHEFKLEEK